jgi:MoaA/NifB/PqqE/SkfB family radical SAM enzyme
MECFFVDTEMRNCSHYKLSANRSPVPDLIYGDYREKRVRETKKYFKTIVDDLPPQWNRITLFTTYRCNLNCVYCKTIRRTPGIPYPAKDKEIDLPGFKRILEMLSPRPVRHIHFTGGEATLVEELPDMIRLAHQQGILCSTTSNGMAPPDVYERLIEAGIDEIRISLDSHEPTEFDRLVRYPGAYERVVTTIQHLIRLRGRHMHRPFVIINMCIGNRNRHRLPEFVEKSISLGADDIKLITIVQARNTLGYFPEKQGIVGRVNTMLKEFPPSVFPLLRYKLKTVFSSEGLGLKDLTSRQLMKNCFIPLTERTLDTTYYYPCSVYLREGGVPLGRIDEDDLKLQQKKILQFIHDSNCLEDPICREYCINCCRRFNQFTNWKIHQSAQSIDGSTIPIQQAVILKDHINPKEVEEIIRAIRDDLASPLSDGDKRPFLVIKPSGLKHKSVILEVLRKERIIIKEERTLPDWNHTALWVYCVPISEENVRRGLMLKRAFHGREDSAATLLILQDDVSLAKLKKVKAQINEMLSPCYLLVRQGDDLAVTLVNYVHTPDSEHWVRECAVLMRASKCT